jgi:hypothetical protein
LILPEKDDLLSSAAADGLLLTDAKEFVDFGKKVIDVERRLCVSVVDYAEFGSKSYNTSFSVGISAF